MTSTPIMDVWLAFARTRTQELRNRLAEHYLPLVEGHAQRIRLKLNSRAPSVEELTSSGCLGLFDAIDGFDVGRGIKFETYAAQRIRGAMFDDLRRLDQASRDDRSRSAGTDRARQQFYAEHGHRPTTEELARWMNVTKAHLSKMEEATRRTLPPARLDAPRYETDTGKDVADVHLMADPSQPTPEAKARREDLRAALLHGLSRTEQLIVVLYYYEEMTMTEIGRTLDLSESRVSQIHTSIIERLKARPRALLDQLAGE